MKIEGKIAGLADWLEILANSFEKPTANIFVDRELGFQFQLAVERDRTGRGEPNVRGAQNQFVDRNHSRTDMVSRLGLLQMELS